MSKLLIICGPTATGKTEVAVSLAKQFDAELVAADSRQVYRGMDIATGKDLTGKETIETMRTDVSFRDVSYSLVPYRFHDVPLWLYDIVAPSDPFSVAHYQQVARHVIANIQKAKKLPIVVGGTGLYIASLLDPLGSVVIPPNSALRKELSTQDVNGLQKRLQQEDPAVWSALNISDRQNPRRLIRKIEIALAKEQEQSTPSHIWDVLLIGLTAPLATLYERIDTRVEERMGEGALIEIQTLQSQYGWEAPAMSAFGYKEWRQWFETRDMADDMQKTEDRSLKQRIVQQWKWDEHAYARRQMTWFKKRKDIHWFDVIHEHVSYDIENLVREWYTES